MKTSQRKFTKISTRWDMDAKLRKKCFSLSAWNDDYAESVRDREQVRLLPWPKR